MMSSCMWGNPLGCPDISGSHKRLQHGYWPWLLPWPFPSPWLWPLAMALPMQPCHVASWPVSWLCPSWTFYGSWTKPEMSPPPTLPWTSLVQMAPLAPCLSAWTLQMASLPPWTSAWTLKMAPVSPWTSAWTLHMAPLASHSQTSWVLVQVLQWPCHGFHGSAGHGSGHGSGHGFAPAA